MSAELVDDAGRDLGFGIEAGASLTDREVNRISGTLTDFFFTCGYRCDCYANGASRCHKGSMFTRHEDALVGRPSMMLFAYCNRRVITNEQTFFSAWTSKWV